MPSQNADRSAVDVFLKSWQVYQDIITHNYMFHNEISDAVRAALVGFKSNEKLCVLDLGCGDGSMTLTLVPAERIETYIGCDLSKPALDIAQRHIDALSISAKLLCDDMLKVAEEQPDQSIDLVLSSYAVHHLNANSKQHLVDQVTRVLKPGGQFVLIDIFREPTEDRAAYMRDYMDVLRKTWSNLSPEAQDLVVNHATEYDYPEQAAFYQLLCDKLGLGSGQRLAKHTWHEAWAFNRAA
jgi:cyclopropane fatty-acyl-phospholipid synthase-like methyltransferase